ncbi:hypothetical protein EH165_00550 [Nakamurella antarctica]|uniref:Uncharacterized protein n=1 Tax=Nakamurella antarctica TaxID=1902245 RepID=A0A3G8ZSW8_9ACTN|nr:hypothetical protein [Nakamurella antarctica]AZI56881.1 hypothetical protein EH165_00550 [Nakamurella antarctica]
MSQDNSVTMIWSESELDEALQDLSADRVPDRQVLVAVRAAVLQTARDASVGYSAGGRLTATELTETVSRRRASRGWLVAAAAVILAVGGVLAPAVNWGGSSFAASAEAQQALSQTSDAVLRSATEPAAGQFKLVQQRVWWSAFNGAFIFLNENLEQTWIPADTNVEWLQIRQQTNNRTWLVGTEDEAKAAGVPVDGTWPTSTMRARCGDFAAEGEGRAECTAPGSWANPTQEFIDSLPSDAAAMFARLKADIPDNGKSSGTMLAYAADALGSGALPSKVQSVLFEAMAMIPGLAITERTANLDGQIGTALGYDDGDVRQDVIVDVASGTYIGQRQVLTQDRDGVPAGSTITYSSVTAQVVGSSGQVPN